MFNIPRNNWIFRAYARLVRRSRISGSAYIAGSAKLGKYLTIDEGATISKSATIHQGTHIRKFATVLPNAAVQGIIPAYAEVGDRGEVIAYKTRRAKPAPKGFLMGEKALHHVVAQFDFNTVLDVGSGEGLHADYFAQHGKQVTRVDFGTSHYFRLNEQQEILKGDYINMELPQQYDCVWACHVLEHQPNVNFFLQKLIRDTKDGGILAITVPPMKDDIVGGHLMLWNAGLLLYHLVFAGLDCRAAHVCSYGYNISVITRKELIPHKPELSYDTGDLVKLRKYFPLPITEPFDGHIPHCNWTV